MKIPFSKQKRIKLIILNWLLLLSACLSAGQAQQKKYLKDNEYEKWGTLDIKSISDKGAWVSCEMSYENQKDTLFLLSTSKTKSYSFPKGKNGSFGAEDIFVFLEPESRLKIIELMSGKIQTFENVSRYESVSDGKYLITLNKGYGQKSLLTIRDKKRKVIDTIAGVTEYIFNSTKDAIMYSATYQNHYQVGIVYFKDYSRSVMSKNNAFKFYNLVWQKESKSVAFLHDSDSVSNSAVLNYYRIKDKKLFSFEDKIRNSGNKLAIYPHFPISISDNDEKVFFMETEKKDSNLKSSTENKKVEVWNGNDKWLYPDRQRIEATGDNPKLAVWFPELNSYTKINSIEQPDFILSAQQENIIIYNKNAYGLQSKYFDETDYFLKNIKDNSESLFLEKQSCDPEQIAFDPNSNKILYYRGKNWWIYDPVQKIRTNLTKNIITNWDNSNEGSAPHQFAVYGTPGWSSDKKNVLLYDANDIWLAAIDGSKCIKLTNGYKKKISFRIAQIQYNKSRNNYNGNTKNTFDLSEDIILEAKNTENWSSGYYIFNLKDREKSLVFEASEIDQIHRSTNNMYVYRKQNFDNPPQVEFKKKNAKTEVLFKSNKQQKEYYFGKSELLYYHDSEGKKLKAALFYPANFNPKRKYPMVVHIYDIMSKELHKYVNPSLRNREGFNVTNYTLNGYFVLLPDIHYELGNPGISALDCVTAAVNSVVNKGVVDESKIGLFGHSFGGYEANFIISQSTIFSAAVSGAGISDIIAMYFNISKNGILQSDMWRFESQQWRMGKSLFDDNEGYTRNSPIMQVENVKTPLLLWAGKNDRIVPYSQSVSYYLALRKLGTKNIMLLYPKEDHSIENPFNQIDLSRKIMAWFDYFLKGDTNSKWITDGTFSN